MRHGVLACALVLLTTTATPGFAQETTTLKTTCAQGSSPTPGAPAKDPDLAGLWDFYMDVGGEPSFGLLTVSRLDGNYGGTLTPVRTAPLIVRSIAVSGQRVKLTVASLEGDVTFNATLSGSADRMCGIVNYHGGLLYPMVAQRRPRGSQAAPR